MTNTRHIIPWKERPELSDRLRELWPDSTFTAMEIAAALGFPCEKNAIIGRAHRMGLPLRGAVGLKGKAHPRWKGGKSARDQRYNARLKLNPREPGFQPVEASMVPPDGVSFIDHTFDQCKWPLTEGPRTIGMDAFQFCARPRMDMKCPYCLEHQRMSRVPGTARRYPNMHVRAA